MARRLTPAEVQLIRWLIERHRSRGGEVAEIDLTTALVDRYDESECLRFVEPGSTDGLGSTTGTHTFDDRDGVTITAFLVLDPQGNLRELDLWKGDDSPIVALPGSYP